MKATKKDREAHPMHLLGSSTRLKIYIVLVIFFSLYALALRGYFQEDEMLKSPFRLGDFTSPDRIDIKARVASINPALETMNLRLNFVPRGRYLNRENKSFQLPIRALIQDEANEDVLLLRKGDALMANEVTMNLDGHIGDYPFDVYRGLMIVEMGDLRNNDMVPTSLEIDTNTQDFRLEATAHAISYPGLLLVQLKVTRSFTVLFMACAGMAFMWAIGIAVILMTLRLATRGFMIDTLAFYSALLFALVGFRNSLPSTPPIGTMSDYIAFFWVIGSVALMLIVKIALLLRHPHTLHTHSDPAKEAVADDIIEEFDQEARSLNGRDPLPGSRI